MTDSLPEPLVPSEVDLREFAYIQIDIVRLFNSEFHARASDSEWRAGMTLWLKSFHQVPAGSIPDDDVALARLAEFGRDLKAWKKVREMALYRWKRCSDGRLYHPVVAEKAIEAWDRKKEYRSRMLRARIAKLEKQVNAAGTEDDKQQLQGQLQKLRQDLSQTLVTDPITDPVIDPITRHKGEGEGEERESKGTGTGNLNTTTKTKTIAPGSATPGAGGNGQAPPSVQIWQAYATAYHTRYSVDPVRNAKVNGQIAHLVSRLGKEAPAVAAFFVRHNNAIYVRARHPVDLLLRDAEGLRTQWATGRISTGLEARSAEQVDAVQAQIERVGRDLEAGS